MNIQFNLTDIKLDTNDALKTARRLRSSLDAINIYLTKIAMRSDKHRDVERVQDLDSALDSVSEAIVEWKDWVSPNVHNY